jgi:anti-anti-sigma factor
MLLSQDQASESREIMSSTTGLFAIDRVGDTVIITPTSDLSELVYQSIVSGASQVLSVLNDPSAKNVVVDLHRTDYFGSTALAFLVRLWKRVTERKGRMALCNLSEHEQEILRVTKLDGLWPLVSSRGEAMRMVCE